MIEYIYIVKCPGREDEMFNFFTDARMQCDLLMSKKPIITQVEVERNDFGECTDSHDLGTVWSWEETMRDTEAGYTEDEPAKSVFTKGDFELMTDDADPEFDSLDNSLDCDPLTEEEQRLAVNNRGEYLVRASSGHGYTVFNRSDICIGGIDSDKDEDAIRRFKLGDLDESIRVPVPEDMSIEDLVEAMEENEDEVECALCNELFPKADCHYDEDEGYICTQCEEDTEKCTWCNFRFDPSELRKEVDLGWLCSRCEMAIKSRGETLTFREGSYWDFLDESTDSESSAFNEDLNLEGSVSETLVKLFNDAADQLDAEGQSKVVSKLLRYVTPDKIESLWDELKNSFEDRVLTEEDKDTLVRKLGIDRKLLDGVDSALTAVDTICRVAPTALGMLIDALELTPIEDIIVGAATGGLGVIVTTILSVIPEGTLIGAISTLEYEIKHDILQKVKDVIIYKVIPEPKSTLGESTLDESKTSFLEELEDSDAYSKRLTDCPECGASQSFDHETGICINCGFNI